MISMKKSSCGILGVIILLLVLQHCSFHALFLLLFGLLAFLFPHSSSAPTYFLDFACYRPPHHLMISKDEFMELARKSAYFSNAALKFQHRVLLSSGIGEQSYMPRVVFKPHHTITLADGREEAAMAMLGAINELLASTKVRPKDIGILVVNCGVLNTTPSLAAMVINRFKLRSNVQSFNLGGMGCSAGVIAVEVATDLLRVHTWATYALVVSTEAISFTWYKGDERRKLLPNCLRMGAAALLLSRACRGAKYQLNRSITHTGFEHACVAAMGKKVLDQMQHKLGLSDHQMEASRNTLERFGYTCSSSIWYELAYLEHAAKIKTGDRVLQITFASGLNCNTLLWIALTNSNKTATHGPWD